MRNEDDLTRALLVIVLDAKTRAYLRANDPKAFEQCLRALRGSNGASALPDALLFEANALGNAAPMSAARNLKAWHDRGERIIAGK